VGEGVTIVAAIEAVALVAVVYLMLRHQRVSESAWTEERRELVNRIQAPERLPIAPQPTFEMPEFEPDEMHLVGTIGDVPEADG
jgi:hypothetical protein